MIFFLKNWSHYSIIKKSYETIDNDKIFIFRLEKANKDIIKLQKFLGINILIKKFPRSNDFSIFIGDLVKIKKFDILKEESKIIKFLKEKNIEKIIKKEYEKILDEFNIDLRKNK